LFFKKKQIDPLNFLFYFSPLILIFNFLILCLFGIRLGGLFRLRGLGDYTVSRKNLIAWLMLGLSRLIDLKQLNL
jgi:hypothetical protein